MRNAVVAPRLLPERVDLANINTCVYRDVGTILYTWTNMCKSVIKQCERCGSRSMPRIKLCDVGKNGFVHLKPTMHSSSPLLRVGTNVITRRKELDLSLLMEEETTMYTCESCS